MLKEEIKIDKLEDKKRTIVQIIQNIKTNRNKVIKKEFNLDNLDHKNQKHAMIKEGIKIDSLEHKH